MHDQPLPHDTRVIHAESRLRDESYVMHGHHCHSCHELFYTESGSCRFLIGDCIHDLQAGDFVLIPPMVLHYTRYVFGSCRRTVVLFDHASIPADVQKLLPLPEEFFTRTQIFQIPEAHRQQIVACLMRLVTEEKISDSFSPLLMERDLQSLFLLSSRYCTFLHDTPEQIHTTDPQIVQAARYISENYMHAISTEDIARSVGFSPNYLSRKFRETAGIGLHEYLVFIRLHHAALELVSTDDSITTIALRCGFSDSNYFKDSFKKKFGLTPRGYRKSISN